MIGEPLNVGERDGVQGLTHEGGELPRVFPIRSLGVSAQSVQPELDQLLITLGLPMSKWHDAGRVGDLDLVHDDPQCAITGLIVRNSGQLSARSGRHLASFRRLSDNFFPPS